MRAGVDQERAVLHLVRSGGVSLAVVDESGAFLGLIPPERMLAVLVEEHDEDIARLGGFLSSTESARSAAEEPVADASGTGSPGCSSASRGRRSLRRS